MQDLQKIANDDSVIYYAVNNSGVLHSYGTIVHLLKILELNPNKEINIFLSKKIYIDGTKKSWDFSNLEQKAGKEYPNLYFDWTNEPEKPIDNSFNLQYSDLMLNKMDSRKNNILFTADTNFIWWVVGEIKQIYKSVERIVNENVFNKIYKLLKNVKEVNILSDGTMSTDAFSNMFYDFFKSGGALFEFNQKTKSFPKLIKLQKELNLMSENEFKEWLYKEKYNAWLYMFSLIAAGKTKEKNVVKINYYLPNTNLIKDVNNKTSTNFNNNVKFDEYFDPYDSKGMNFINFIQSLNQESLKEFFFITKTKQIDQSLFSQFNDHLNLIYVGGLMKGDANSTYTEAKRMISLLKLGIDKYPNNNVQIWFKGHPRDLENYDTNLYNEIARIVNKDKTIVNKQDFLSRIKFLDKNIVLELYIATKLLSNSPSDNRIVKQYLSYSTYTLSLLAYDETQVEKIIVNDKNLKDIIRRFGNPKESLCFPEKYLIKENELFNK